MKSLPFTSVGHNFTWDVLLGSWVYLALALLCFHTLYNSFSPVFPVRSHLYNWVYDVSLLSSWEWLITSPFIRDGKKTHRKEMLKIKICYFCHSWRTFFFIKWSILRAQESFKILFPWFRLLLLYPFNILPTISPLTALALHFLVFPFCLSPTYLSQGLVPLKIYRTSL